MRFLKKLDAIVGKVLSFLGLASMIVLFVILLANIIIRAAGAGITLSWYSEVVEILFAWMVMIGAAMLLTGKWNKPGVYTVEEFDPDPYMEALNKWGLPWQIDDKPVLVD